MHKIFHRCKLEYPDLTILRSGKNRSASRCSRLATERMLLISHMSYRNTNMTFLVPPRLRVQTNPKIYRLTTTSIPLRRKQAETTFSSSQELILQDSMTLRFLGTSCLPSKGFTIQTFSK